MEDDLEKILIDALEPHYTNMGFEWGADARNAAKKSVTYKNLKNNIERLISQSRVDEWNNIDVNILGHSTTPENKFNPTWQGGFNFARKHFKRFKIERIKELNREIDEDA